MDIRHRMMTNQTKKNIQKNKKMSNIDPPKKTFHEELTETRVCG
jgi:hypothetical protein